MRKSDYPKVIRRGVAGMVILLLLLLLLGAFAPAAMAADWPNCDWYTNCTWGCTADDVEINRAYLGYCNNSTALPETCTAGTPINACIWAEFHCKSAARTQIYTIFNLTIDGDNKGTYCDCIDNLSAHARFTRKIYGTLNWTCGQEVKLENITVSWATTECNCSERAYCKGPGPGCKHGTSQCWGGNINVSTPLSANFTHTDQCYCTNINFYDKTTGGKKPYVNWSWDFDNGSYSYQQDTSHHYGAAGTYNVTLTVTDSNTTPNTDSQSYNVTVYENPIASFISNSPQCLGTEIDFNGSASNGTGPYNYSWDFGDGTGTSTVEDPSYLYTANGTYTVNLTVNDTNGCKGYYEADVEVYENPIASFISNSPQCLGTEIDFNGSASNGTGPYNYSWDFGDGTGTSTVEDPSYKYAANGTYTVNLTVNDTNGCKGYYEADVEVYENPIASFISNSPQCIGTEIDFNGSASGGTGPYNYSWDFGDGTGTSTVEDPSYLYTANGTYTVNLTVNDTNGCEGYYEADVEVYENPTASFTSNSPQCLGTEIDFDGSASNGTGPYTYDWDFGDGTGTSSAEDPSYLYTANGTYTVNLTVNDTNGCKGYYEADVEVYENPTASFTSNSPQCLGTEIDFDGSASGGTGPYNYSWDFGDGTGTSSAEDPSYLYTANGTYTVNLTVNDTNGCKGYYEADVEVYENPTASFISNSPQCIGTEIDFDGSASGGTGPYNYSWDFGDGTGTSSAEDPSYLYTANGTYTVNLTVNDTNGCEGYYEADVEVYENPTASFTSNSPQCLGTEIDFDGSASNGTGPYTYDWDFGDGTGTSSAEDPSYLYTANGTYTVNLTVNDTNGCKGYYEADVEVYENPTASFISNSPQCIGTEIDFDGSASGGTGPYNYSWDFGDGTGTSTVEDPSYKYAANGTYTVNLTVNDTNGCKGYYEADVEVYENPIASFTSNSPQCIGTEIDFNGSASGGTGPYNYSWDFGDGTGTSSAEDPSYLYTANGTYTVNLTVNDTNGCKGYYEADVEVYENPTASFISNSPQCLGTEIDFNGSASNGTGPYNYSWDFGDGTGTSTVEDPSYLYTANGTYTVNLTVNDTNGCKGYYEADVEVYENPTASFISNSPQCIGTEIDFNGSASGGTGPYNYSWDFGDGTGTSTVEDPSYLYTANGTYTVNLTVNDTNGCKGYYEADVEVYENPVADFVSDSPQIYCHNITFNDTTTGGTPSYTWLWDFDDGNSSIEQNPSHHYSAPGTYNVTLNVTDANGCSNSTTKQVEVTIAPGISVTKTASPTAGAPSTNVNFTIVVTNTGNCTLNPVKVVDTLPTGMSYVSSSPTANTTGGTTIWDNVGPLTSSGGSKTLYLVAHIDFGASGTLTDLVNATGTPPAGDNVTDSDTATVVVRPKPTPPIPPITRPQQAQYFSEKSSVQGVGEIFYEKTISASGVGVREYMWGNTGNGTFAMTITEILNEGVRLNCSGNCSDMGNMTDPIYGDDESPVMTNFECKKMVQFEIGAKDNPLIYGLEGEAIYSNPGFSGGMNAQVNEYYAVSSLQKDETAKMTTTATFDGSTRDWTDCNPAKPYNANELNFDTKNAFTGSWGTDSSWEKVCSKDIKHHQYFEGEFQVDKNLMFQEEVTKPWPEKEPHGDC